MLSPSNGYRLVVMLYLKRRNQKNPVRCNAMATRRPAHLIQMLCAARNFEVVRLKRWRLCEQNSQCYSSRPNVHFKPWKGVQSVGYFWRLEGRRALTGATCVVFCKRMKGLKTCRGKNHVTSSPLRKKKFKSTQSKHHLTSSCIWEPLSLCWFKYPRLLNSDKLEHKIHVCNGQITPLLIVDRRKAIKGDKWQASCFLQLLSEEWQHDGLK